MFGIYRYALSMMVLYGHLWRAYVEHSASYAVFSFFMLSGFLMAFVLADVYGFSARGLGRFLTNRALRIFPPYLVVVLGSILVVLAVPGVAAEINPVLRLPASAPEWFRNVAIFGLSDGGVAALRADARLVPSAWSLDIELFFYVAMALVLARSRVIVAVWFAASLAYTGYMLEAEFVFRDRYFSVLGASLPFSVGALLFHLKDRLPALPVWHLPLAILVFALNLATSSTLWADSTLTPLYLSLLTSAYVLVVLSQVDRNKLPRWLAGTDRLLGDVAYPLFLCHWAVAALVAWGIGSSARGAALFFGTAVLASIFAFGVHDLVERRVNRIRDAVRARAKAAA